MAEQSKQVLVVGAGMAGLAASLVLARAGWPVRLLEQAPAFAEVGAGIQLGPNAMRVLDDWGLSSAVRSVAAFPQQLLVRDASHGAVLGTLPLGASMQQRYGQPYATIHRADLHRILLQQALATDQVLPQLGSKVTTFHQHDAELELSLATGVTLSAPVVLGCDGLWSRVRAQLLADGDPVFSGDLAYRGLVRMSALPADLQRNQVTAWLAPGLHAVHYPVSGGEWMNVVVVVEGPLPTEPANWNHIADEAQLYRALGAVHTDLLRLLQSISNWRLWPLLARLPMQGPQQHAQGRVALLGDAAHPTRPYLAQGAAMALEDAWTLGRLLGQTRWQSAEGFNWSGLLQTLANSRWQRNAWLQERSRRNGDIFHARGPLRWGRDWAMRLLGERLMDVPELYRGPPAPL